MTTEITKEQFEAWMGNRVTQRVLAECANRAASIGVSMARGGSLIGDSAESTLSQTAAMVGQARAYSDIAGLTYDDLFSTSTEEQHAEET